MRHRDSSHADNAIVEDSNRNLEHALSPGRNRDVDAPHERARVRHAGVQRHDVQMVGVAGQDVLDQVRCAGGRQFWVDRRFTMEDGITCWHHVGARRPVDADWCQRAVSAHAHAPPVEQHASQITDVVGMQVGKEHRFQTGEAEPAPANPDGDPRPQSTTKTRSSTMSAEEIPARPATGNGAPAVPSSTNSVAMLTSSFTGRVINSPTANTFTGKTR